MLGPFPSDESAGGRCRSLAVGGSVRLQQTLTPCVAPLGNFTSLRQPVKGGNMTLITISRTKLHETTLRSIQPRTHVVCRASPFFSDLRIILLLSLRPVSNKTRYPTKRVALGNSRSVVAATSAIAFNNPGALLKECAIVAQNSD